jgi:hypothetical protein
VALAAVAALVGFAAFERGLWVHAAEVDPWPSVVSAVAPLAAAGGSVILYGRATAARHLIALRLGARAAMIDEPGALAARWPRERLAAVVPSERVDEIVAALRQWPHVVLATTGSMVIIANWDPPAQ